MKVIDLLKTPINKLPHKIKVEDKTYTLYVDEDTNYHYYQDDKCKYFMFGVSCFEELNDEVEIIEDTPKEDKKIEPIREPVWAIDNSILKSKINEIIDKLNGE